MFVYSGVDPGEGEDEGDDAPPPIKNTGTRVSFRPLNVLAFLLLTSITCTL